MRMIACVVKHMLGGTCWTLFSQEVCNEAAQQEAVCAAYNVRSSSCAFMDEALLWHADCAGASFQQLCCSCSSDAAESLRLYSAFNVPLLSPPALHRAIVLGGALPMTDSRSAYTKVSLCFSGMALSCRGYRGHFPVEWKGHKHWAPPPQQGAFL